MITKRARSWLRRAATLAVTAAVLFVVVGTWIVTEHIDSALLEVEPEMLAYDIEVLGLGEGTVVLEGVPAAAAAGEWGLEWESGYARVGEVVQADEVSVTRRLLEAPGNLAAGALVAMDRFAYESSPGDLGLAFAEVDVEGPLGDYPAWRIDGTDDTWVVFVHGRGSYRREALRLLETTAGLGFPALVITYRNDPAAPESPNRRYSLGKHEWKDLEAAVEYAVAAGAADVVLVGYGMGGGVTATFLRESAWAPRVAGMVLDAPLLDPGAVVAADAAARDVPGFVLALARGLAGLRYGVDWLRLDQVRHADEFEAPILLFHGDADEVVPIGPSDEFAEAAAEIVRYRRVVGAGYGGSWNSDPEAYRAAAAGFLTEVALGPSDLEPPDEDLLDDLDTDDEEFQATGGGGG